MRVSRKALTIVFALLWGGCMLLVGVVNLIAPAYGSTFLQVMSSVYPGFHASHAVGDVLLGTVYGLADGAAGGFVCAWLYNLCLG